MSTFHDRFTRGLDTGRYHPALWDSEEEKLVLLNKDSVLIDESIIGGNAIIEDTAANLATSNPTPASGQVIRATDTNEVAFGNGTDPWLTLAHYESESGKELAWAESSVMQSGIATAPVDLTGLSITFTVGTRPVIVELHLPFAWGTLDAPGRASIADAAGTELRSTVFYPSANNGVEAITIYQRISTPGSYTRKGKLGRNGGTGSFSNGVNLAQYTSHITAYER